MANLERGLQIHELLTALTVHSGDYIAIDDGTTTYKTTVGSVSTAAAQNAQTYANQAASSATAAASSATQAATSAQSVNGAIIQATSTLQGYVNAAQASAASAAVSEANTRALVTSDYAKTAKSYAVGDTGYRPGEETDNARYYSRITQQISDETAEYVDISEENANIAINCKTDAEEAKEDAESARDQVIDLLTLATFTVDFTTGNLMYDRNEAYTFNINTQTGNLEWEVVA